MHRKFNQIYSLKLVFCICVHVFTLSCDRYSWNCHEKPITIKPMIKPSKFIPLWVPYIINGSDHKKTQWGRKFDILFFWLMQIKWLGPRIERCWFPVVITVRSSTKSVPDDEFWQPNHFKTSHLCYINDSGSSSKIQDGHCNLLLAETFQVTTSFLLVWFYSVFLGNCTWWTEYPIGIIYHFTPIFDIQDGHHALGLHGYSFCSICQFYLVEKGT